MKKGPITVGNWKMNKTFTETEEFINELKTRLKKCNNKIIICVPFTNISIAIELTKDTQISVGAQNCHFENSGAYTGEISPAMLKDLGVKYVILGHSERRDYFCETDEIINKKIKSALNSGLKVILCVGETLQERKFNVAKEKISMQIKKALYGIDEKSLENIMIAYEPIWAIGSGKSAEKDDANNICGFIKEVLSNMYPLSSVEKISVLYGGSINAQNAKALFDMGNIDGGLIGVASLNIDEFLKITENIST